MTHLTFLVRFIIRQLSHLRAQLLLAFTVIALILAQPLLVSANPIPPIGSIHDKSQVAKVAQSTPAPQEEPTEKPTEEPSEEPTEAPSEEPTEEPSEEPTEAPSEEPTEEPSEEPTEAPSEEPTQEPTEEPTAESTQEPLEEATVEATQVVEEPTTTPVAEQPSPVGAAATAIITVEVPAPSTLTGIISYTLPTEWQGTEAIPAEDLAKVAPPLQAEVIQGQFQVAYVPSPSKAAGEAVLRILPLLTASELGTLRLGLRLDPSSTTIPFPAGQTLVAQLTARVYAPDATTRLVIADEDGSSSVAIAGLNWSDYQVARHIAADATSLEVVVEWRNVPSNAWLEVRGFKLIPAPAKAAIEISPTDTPTTGETSAEEAVITPTTQLPSTPKAPAAAAALPTATPVPETISGTADISATVPFIIVTSTPTAADVFEEATRVAQATDWARILGPATPTPLNLATPTPTITPIVVTNTPEPANAATATQMAIRATAIAFTTGTPTPLPDNALIVVATETPVKPAPTERATATVTPIFILLDDIPVADATVTPGVPPELTDKIIFLSSYRGNPRAPNAMVMNPDGTGIGLLTTNYFYTVLAASDSYSADGRFYAFSLHDSGGTAHNAGAIQIFYTDSLYDNTPHQLTYFGDGVAWAPSWSPNSQTVAYVSNETGNDEIYVSQLNQWPGTQLTKNSWEWDHHPSFSPNGSEIVFDSNRVGGRRQLWIMSASGENQRQLTNFTFEAWDPVWVKFVASEVVSASNSTVDP